MFDLQTFRKVKNISQKTIIEMVNLSQGYISEIENGKKPMPKEAYDKLYNIYGDELKDYEKPEIPSPKIDNMLSEITALRNEIALLRELLSAKNEIIESLRSENQSLKNTGGLNKQAV